jgi:hypothetical protein
MIGAPPGE